MHRMWQVWLLRNVAFMLALQKLLLAIYVDDTIAKSNAYTDFGSSEISKYLVRSVVEVVSWMSKLMSQSVPSSK